MLTLSIFLQSWITVKMVNALLGNREWHSVHHYLPPDMHVCMPVLCVTSVKLLAFLSKMLWMKLVNSEVR